MMGGYLARATWLHQLPPRLKLLIVAGMSLALMPVRDWHLLALCLAVVAGVYGTLGRDAVRRLSLFKPLVPLLVIIGGLQGFSSHWEDGASVVLRFLLMVLVADLVTMTTTMSALMDAVEPLFRLLRPLGVNSRRIALSVALVLRFIPVLLASWRAREEAWRSRSPRRIPLRIVVLFLIETLRMADHVADALDARGYGRAGRQP
jgi:biotin transport system permease protein